ncbi:ANKRD17 [Symbiodinium sp. CCMP2456]|nr:ANKRD17 [Symbiodinium sp. CCMP2456]
MAAVEASHHGGSCHEQKFPMWVVSMSELQEMRAPMHPHEQLLQSGQVILHESSFHTIFVSHQWLGRHHPDPEGKQLAVLQHAVRGFISGALRLETDVVTTFFHGNRMFSADERRAIRDGYVWLDWFCIPQDKKRGPDRLRAIKSIPSYVDSCNVFVSLVPRVPHESGNLCDYESWCRRGWCLAELWCAQLANRSSLPMIAVHGEDDVEFVMAQHWIYLRPYEGEFSLESDRSAVQHMVQISLESRISCLEEHKTQPGLCRYLKARLHDWGGGQAQHLQESEECFLEHFGFRNLAEGLRVRDVGALACAILSDNVPMVWRLLQAKAPMHVFCRPMLSVDVLAWTPLHLAVQRGSRALPMLAELFRLRADPNATDSVGNSLLGTSPDASTVEFLVQNRADVNLRTGLSFNSPLQYCCAKAPPVQVVAKLLELRADVNARSGGLGNPALSNLAFFSRPVQARGVELATVLVTARADVNAQGRSGGFFRVLEVSCRGAHMVGQTGVFASFFANIGSSPLAFAALCGNERMVSFLLSAKANPDLPNFRGRSPRQLADHRVRHLFTDSMEGLHNESQRDVDEWDLPTECTPEPLKSDGFRGFRPDLARSAPPYLPAHSCCFRSGCEEVLPAS